VLGLYAPLGRARRPARSVGHGSRRVGYRSAGVLRPLTANPSPSCGLGVL